MSVGRHYWLMCDYVGGCDDESPTETYLTEARKTAKAEGWVCTDIGDFCPDHAGPHRSHA